VSQDPPLAELLAEEAELVFDEFDHQIAWALGESLRRAALEADLPVAIAIRLNGQRLFHAALPGSSADNDGWLDRKAAVVDRFAHSSYFVGCQFRESGGDFDVDARLDNTVYAAHGGAIPLTVRSVGCVGSIAVSGLPQIEDHQFVVGVLRRFLAGVERPDSR
jgi:uncharacterized protein (UPF0303 family)